MILWEQMNQGNACDVVPVGEGRRDQMFLKKQDLTRKKKQNFLLVRSTYSLVFIKKKISGMSCTDLDGSGKGMYKRLSYTLLMENNYKKQVEKNGTEFTLFLTNL